MTQRYTVVLQREPDGGYHVFCPALPGCHSQGDTLDEALAIADLERKKGTLLCYNNILMDQEKLPFSKILAPASSD